MRDLMKKRGLLTHGFAFGNGEDSHDLLRRRLTSLGLSMIVMAICFPLYYLGLFGSVEGPLNPSQLGTNLAAMGVTRTHVLVGFLALSVVAITWNWIYNFMNLLIGSRLTCVKKIDEGGTVCGAAVMRKKVVNRKTGKMITEYICNHRHKRPEAHFHPVEKGIFSHTFWIVSLVFCVIVFFQS